MTLNYEQYKASGYVLPTLPLDVDTITNLVMTEVPKEQIEYLKRLGWRRSQLKRKK